MSESDVYSRLFGKACKLEDENAQLKARVAELQQWYDATFGLPSEEIRHAQQVEALESELEQVKANRDEFHSLNEHHKAQFLTVNLELATLTQREARLREALKFYAEPQHYGINGGSNEWVLGDAGKRARQALKEPHENA